MLFLVIIERINNKGYIMKLTELGTKALEKKIVPHGKRIYYYTKYFANEIETVEELLNSGFTINAPNQNSKGRIVPNWERDFLRAPYMGRKTLVFLKSLLNENGYPVV